MSRLDKYLWAIRVFKTRSDAADACKSGKVKVNDMEAKASREVKQGDTISVRKVNVIFQFRVVAPVENRQPAKLVEEYAINITPQSELDKLNVPRETLHLVRERGTGRPTKKDRREMDDLIENLWDEE
ncbi:MAG: S4 domain-containing protein [Bacteroidales bacterium]|jgi:ribosome-associated heat shock protein Hsp15|nr:RNA-binding S4 domain-containing protein [Bacteroidales bacterium]MDD4492723.1 S4 domain-containing protein [Bacteroidales bacterium]HNW49090.1 S4 domain-containing protein [Bacteroidales bacterium]HPS96261.1 S4 domain-containing protein [Bacteroidales bacterium]